MSHQEMLKHPEGGTMVHFIQWLRPNRKRSDQWIKCGPEIYTKASELWAAGFVLDVEITDQTVWFTAHPPSDWKDAFPLDEFSMNGPDVPKAVNRLVTDAHAILVGRRRK